MPAIQWCAAAIQWCAAALNLCGVSLPEVQIEIAAKRNEIIDQSSLIARYQQEIVLLRGQLEIVMREGGARKLRSYLLGTQRPKCRLAHPLLRCPWVHGSFVRP